MGVDCSMVHYLHKSEERIAVELHMRWMQRRGKSLGKVYQTIILETKF